MELKLQFLILLSFTVGAFNICLAQKPVFFADFNKSTTAVTADDGKNIPISPNKLSSHLHLTSEGEGYTGRGVFFARENLADFASVAKDGSKPRLDLFYPGVKLPVEAGTLSMQIKPYFNQTQPYPGAAMKFKLYYLFCASPGLNIFIYNRTLYVRMMLANGKRVDLCYDTRKWRPGTWHQLWVTWGKKGKILYIDGLKVDESANSCSFKQTANIILGGKDSKVSFQGIIDDFAIYDRVIKPEKVKNIFTVPQVKVDNDIQDFDEKFTFTVETPEAQVQVALNPRNFLIKKGKKYFITYSAFLPGKEVTAKTDGKLFFTIPATDRTKVAVSEVKVGNLIPDNSFETPQASIWKQGWGFKPPALKPVNIKSLKLPEYKKLPIPADKVVYSSKFIRTGKRSICMEHRDIRNKLQYQTGTIDLAPADSYYLSGFYYPAEYGVKSFYGLSVRIVYNNSTVARAEDHYYLSSPPLWTPAGKWRFTDMLIKIPEKYRNKKLQAILTLSSWGTASEVYWDDLDLRPAPVLAELKIGKQSNYKPLLSVSQVAELIKKRPKLEGEVVRKNQQTTLAINGKVEPFLPSCCRGDSSMRLASKKGINLHMINIYSNNWLNKRTSFWKGKNKYDFSWVDKAIIKVLKYAPNAQVILLCDSAYTELAKDYPESAWITHKGETGVKFKNTIPVQAVSYISKDIRRELGNMYYALGQYLKNSPYGKVVVGLHFSFGSDGQWYPALYWTQKNFDYSEGSRLALVEKVREKYNNNIHNLRKAWGMPDLTFETVKLPTPQEMQTVRKFLNPADPAERRLIELPLFYHEAINDTKEHIAKRFKEGIAKKTIVTSYYASSSAAINNTMLKAEYLDGYVVLPSYMRPRNLGGHSTPSHSIASANLHKKLFLQETDFRSNYSNYQNHNFWRYLGMAPDWFGHANRVRRNFGYVFSQGGWGWLMTMGFKGHATWAGHYAEIQAEVLRAAKLNTAPPVNPQSHPQVIVFNDDRALAYRSFKCRFDHYFSYHVNNLFGLHYSGLSYKDYNILDLDNPQRAKANIYIFSGVATLRADQTNYIKENLQKDGNILIFANDTGRLAQGGFEASIYQLTGMRVKKREDIQVPYSYQLITFSDKLSTDFWNKPMWVDNFKGPLFYVDDASATPLALIKDTKLVGMAVKRHKNWTAVYLSSGTDCLGTKFFGELAKEAGIIPVGPQDEITYFGNDFLVIHAVKPGKKQLNWGYDADLYDITADKIIARKVKTVAVDMKFGETRWFKLK